MNMSTKNQTSIIAEPGKQEVYIIREFDAPRDMVYQAHTDADMLAQWMGPADRVVKFEKFDPRPGGFYRYTVSSKDGKEIAAFHGSVHEATAPERVIQTFEFEGLPERGHVAMETALFEELPGNRTKVTVHSVFRSVADRDGMMQSGMEMGVNDGYEKLDTLLAKM